MTHGSDILMVVVGSGSVPDVFLLPPSARNYTGEGVINLPTLNFAQKRILGAWEGCVVRWLYQLIVLVLKVLLMLPI